jgi:thioredoxin-disulfide reductase
MYDLIIIGAGPAGITAAIYAARKRLEFLVISENIGGQAILSSKVENYTGYQEIPGDELVKKFNNHMKEFDVGYKEEEAEGIERSEKGFLVKTNKNSYEAKTLIIATGARHRELNVPGEKKFKNRGISYCATCDAPLFSGKDVAVIGGGDSALDAALQLDRIANKVHIINITPALEGEDIRREKVEGSEKISIINNANTIEILGDKLVTGLRYKKEEKEYELNVQGIFIEIGYVPNSDFVSDVLELNEKKEIKIDKSNKTNVNGIFAAGDVTDVHEKQIIIAAGEGSKALLSAYGYLTGLKD